MHVWASDCEEREGGVGYVFGGYQLVMCVCFSLYHRQDQRPGDCQDCHAGG